MVEQRLLLLRVADRNVLALRCPRMGSRIALSNEASSYRATINRLCGNGLRHSSHSLLAVAVCCRQVLVTPADSASLPHSLMRKAERFWSLKLALPGDPRPSREKVRSESGSTNQTPAKNENQLQPGREKQPINNIRPQRSWRDGPPLCRHSQGLCRRA